MKKGLIPRFLLYFAFLWEGTYITLAQTPADSLQKELTKANHDSTRLKIYAGLLKATLYSNPTLARQSAQKFDSIAANLRSEIDIAYGKNYLGMVNYVNNDYTAAIKHYLEAIDRFEKLKMPLRVGISLNNIGACYQYRDEPKQTIEYYRKALAIFQKLNETVWIGNVSHNISNEYFKVANRNPNQNEKLNALIEAETYEKIALRSFEAQEDNHSIGLSYINLGNIKYEKRIFEEAIRDYTKAKSLLNFKDDPISEGMIYENIGNALFELKRYEEAIVNLNQAGKIFREVKALPSLKKTLDVLLRVYEAKQDYKRAFEIQKEFVTLSDSIFNQEKDRAMLDVLKKYESDKKEQENQFLNQQLKQEQQQRIFYLFGFLSLLVFSGIIGYFFVKNRQKNRLIESQNRKLSNLNREKNHLISMVSHDLSTPFLTIKMWNSLLKMNLQDNSKASEAIQVIEKSAEQGMSLIKNILDVEKAETNRHDLQLEKVDLIAVIHGVIGAVEVSAQTKNIKIHFEPSAEKVSLLSDKHLIIRILENLLSNAIKYSNPESQVWVSVQELSDKIQLKIKDEGVGIDSKDVPKLFTKYGVAASKPTAGESSTGLGLSIVKRILDEIGGDIHCQSELGKGTEFTVRFEKAK